MKPEVFLPDDYRPAEDEPFMNDRQLEYFRRKLLNWKADLMSDSRDTVAGMGGPRLWVFDRAARLTCGAGRSTVHGHGEKRG